MSHFQEGMHSSRLATFKNKGKDSEEMRRRRCTATIELRKASRDNQILKKRNISSIDDLFLMSENLSPQHSKTINVGEILEGLKNTDLQEVLKAIQSARKILSGEKNPPIRMVIEAGIVPHCVRLLDDCYGTDIQFEACWSLTNIASGTSEETNEVIRAGAIPILIKLLRSRDLRVCEQAVWTLGNIAGDGPEGRDAVILAGALTPILQLAESNVTISTLKNIVWTISNLCRNKNPPPPFNEVKACLPTLRKMLFCSDNDVLADACWTFSYLTDGSDDQIQAVIEADVVPKLVELLSSPVPAVLTPSLRAVGNIVTGNEKQTDSVIQAGALPKIRELLFNKKMNIVKEAAWTISNITAGSSAQIQEIIDADILPPLVEILESRDFKSQKEAAWAITNLATGATIQQLSELIKCGVLTPFCNLLDSKDNKTVVVVLDGIQNILCKADGIGQLDRVATLIEECGGLDKLEGLQAHEMQQIYKKAYNIIDAYFNGENPQGDVSIDTVNGQYEFKAEEPVEKFTF